MKALKHVLLEAAYFRADTAAGHIAKQCLRQERPLDEYIAWRLSPKAEPLNGFWAAAEPNVLQGFIDHAAGKFCK